MKIKIWQVGLAAFAALLVSNMTSKIIAAAKEPTVKVWPVVIKTKPVAEPVPSLPLQVKTLVWKGDITSRVQFKLTNPNSFLITNPIIKCTYYGASDTPISSVTLPIYVNVLGNKSVVTDEIVLGFMPQQGKIIRCGVNA